MPFQWREICSWSDDDLSCQRREDYGRGMISSKWRATRNFWSGFKRLCVGTDLSPMAGLLAAKNVPQLRACVCFDRDHVSGTSTLRAQFKTPPANKPQPMGQGFI